MNKIKTPEIEIFLAHKFRYANNNIVVPNVSWGADIGHECDILVLSKAGYATEIEIKISKSDLKKDVEKSHGHDSRKIKYLYFAIPEDISDDKTIKYIPERAGIIVVSRAIYNPRNLKSKTIRKPVARRDAIKWSNDDRNNLHRLAYHRMWPLKKKIFNLLNK